MRKKNAYIYPDETFMDSENIPAFKTAQFEGVIEKPISRRVFINIMGVFLLIVIFFAGRIFDLQVVRGDYFRARSENNRLKSEVLFPDRAIIYDRNNVPLVWNDFDLRIYSDLPGLSHILGFVGLPSRNDMERLGLVSPELMVGKDGIEAAYEKRLSGEPGTKLIERNSKGEITSESVEEPAKHGENITLTIDSRLQSRFFEILNSVAKDRGFLGGAGVIMDARDGSILSLISVPEYSSNVMSKRDSPGEIKRLLGDDRKPFLNRAISGLYEPGSTIKPLIALAALGEGIITPEEKIFSSGSISIPNPFFPDLKSVFLDWKAHGWVNMRQALSVSSNVYFYEVGGGYERMKGLGIQKINEYGRRFGFEEKTGIDLPGEEVGTVPSPERKRENNPEDPIWRIGDTYHTSIGQGIFQVTPVRMAVYAAIIANSGSIVRPHLYLHGEGEDSALPPEDYVIKNLELPKEYFNVIQEGMRLGVLEGTASALNISGVKIAAKTGTAQVGPLKQKVNSWIIGFFPYEEPKYVFTIVLEKGASGNLVGALYSARELVDWISVYRPNYF
ncbi:MAG TPA: penicillin-binding transpeptidase domain-containing protein [Candidatus Paceibacterota bacterium]